MKEKDKEKQFDGYIDSVLFGGKLYELRCRVVTVEPIACPKCGASFELKYGSGKCEYCGTFYTTEFKLREQ